MTNLIYLLLSGPLKRNMCTTNDLRSSFLLSVLFSDFFGTLFLTAEALRWQTHPRLQWVYVCSSLGGASPLLQCDVQLVSSDFAASAPSRSTLFCCRSPSDRLGCLAGVSSAAPPKPQESGTSAMQKAIYSQSYRRERAKRDRDP